MVSANTSAHVRSRTPLSIVTGVLLILAPLIAWFFKLFSMGWMIVIIFLGPIVVLLAGYILLIVIASQGFLSRKGLFGPGARRPTVASWLTSLSFICFGIFMPDGADNGYGSTFQVWLGAYGVNGDAVHAATDGFNDIFALVLVVVWLASFVWLFVEWVIALTKRSKEKKAARVAAHISNTASF